MIQPEPLYTIQELTMLHGLSRMTIARLYENEPGVLILSRKIRNKRGHRTNEGSSPCSLAGNEKADGELNVNFHRLDRGRNRGIHNDLLGLIPRRVIFFRCLYATMAQKF